MADIFGYYKSVEDGITLVNFVTKQDIREIAQSGSKQQKRDAHRLIYRVELMDGKYKRKLRSRHGGQPKETDRDFFLRAHSEAEKLRKKRKRKRDDTKSEFYNLKLLMGWP